jgi:uncharacterized protein
MSANVNEAGNDLVESLRNLGGCVVAYSGGVDSAVVAKAAWLALGQRAVAVTGVSGSLAAGELQGAQELARSIGIRHLTVNTAELADANYLRNDPDRCFHCKTELYKRLRTEADRLGLPHVVNGANADDLSDFRPGMQAAAERSVRSPLAEIRLTKADVRALACHWNLEVWDKPATPCLSSRVVYGLEITPERLARVDAAEQALRQFGFTNVRVRLHTDELARIEVSLESLPRLLEPEIRGKFIHRMRELGFRYVTLDLEGFRTGSFQQLVPAETLSKFKRKSTV